MQQVRWYIIKSTSNIGRDKLDLLFNKLSLYVENDLFNEWKRINQNIDLISLSEFGKLIKPNFEKVSYFFISSDLSEIISNNLFKFLFKKFNIRFVSTAALNLNEVNDILIKAKEDKVSSSSNINYILDKGSKVEIFGGPFEGFSGIVNCYLCSGFYLVRIELMGIQYVPISKDVIMLHK